MDCSSTLHHGARESRETGGCGPPRILLVGSPNVGKSVLFHRLTGRYVTVSNYPGTSVEIVRGDGAFGEASFSVVDTPGIYSLLPTTEEEQVTRRILLSGEVDLLIHVIDTKTLARSLPLTLQLAEVGRPLVVALNMMDEARRLGFRVDVDLLSRRLGVPVVPLVAVEGWGVDELRRAVVRAVKAPPPIPPAYRNGVGEAIRAVEGGLASVYPVAPAVMASLLLQQDPAVRLLVEARESDAGRGAIRAAEEAETRFGTPPAYRAAVERQRLADGLSEAVVSRTDTRTRPGALRLGTLLTNPWFGGPFFLLVLYVGLYDFVGRFGAGTVVDWLEGTVFEGWINPWLEALFAGIPWESMRALYVGEYGILTLGLRYAVALVLPIVGTFFLFFSVLEDSGFFPRLALLVDRIFKRLGLNGRAVIPLVLGFACDTMATMVTRTLETKRERVLATLLLALAIPCSAQLGVILAILSGHPGAFAVWAGVVGASFLLVGWLGARLLPGRPAGFHMELPPLRRPRVGNVLMKTYTRMHWYFLEILPLFLLASVILWIMHITGTFDVVVAGLSPLVGALGLPKETATVFLFGFFRRDYGAAGLFDLTQAGALDMIQVTVAAVTLTLFVPCVAQFLVMLKERGARMAVSVFLFATVFAFGVGWVLNVALRVVAGAQG